jgi:hypothetical protein
MILDRVGLAGEHLSVRPPQDLNPVTRPVGNVGL